MAGGGISHDAVVAVVTNLRQSPATDLCCDEVECTRTSTSLCSVSMFSPDNPRPVGSRFVHLSARRLL